MAIYFAPQTQQPQVIVRGHRHSALESLFPQLIGEVGRGVVDTYSGKALIRAKGEQESAMQKALYAHEDTNLDKELAIRREQMQQNAGLNAAQIAAINEQTSANRDQTRALMESIQQTREQSRGSAAIAQEEKKQGEVGKQAYISQALNLGSAPVYADQNQRIADKAYKDANLGFGVVNWNPIRSTVVRLKNTAIQSTEPSEKLAALNALDSLQSEVSSHQAGLGSPISWLFQRTLAPALGLDSPKKINDDLSEFLAGDQARSIRREAVRASGSPEAAQMSAELQYAPKVNAVAADALNRTYGQPLNSTPMKAPQMGPPQFQSGPGPSYMPRPSPAAPTGQPQVFSPDTQKALFDLGVNQLQGNQNVAPPLATPQGTPGGPQSSTFDPQAIGQRMAMQKLYEMGLVA